MGDEPEAVIGTNPFNTDPAGRFFVGRHREIALLQQWLSAIQSQPQHACIVGRQGEGKTSLLLKAKSEALSCGLVACSSRIDAKRSAEQNIKSIIEALLNEIDNVAKLELRKDWKAGKSSSFRTPQEDDIRTDDLVSDLQSFLRQLASVGVKPACLICLDDGQAIHPFALSTLRNALQDVGAGYMLLMTVRNDNVDLRNNVEGPRMIEEFATTSTDSGLPRLFAKNFISLGPFEDQLEADECIRTRLKNRPIAFSDGVISSIGRVTGRYPHLMMVLANAVYSLAEGLGSNVKMADEVVFKQAFINTQKTLVDEAINFSVQESNTRKEVYRHALHHDGVFTCLQIAKAMLGNGSGGLNEADFAADPVGVAIDRLVSANFCVRSGNGQYQWSDPLRAHALRIIVG